MKIIPVIDYRQGRVVLAQMGNRESYQAISSVLCETSDIYSVIEGILTLAEFKTIYIADLDCIENQQLNRTIWPTLCSKYPDIEFWIDLGRVSQYWEQEMSNTPNARPVIGSESYTSIESIHTSIMALHQYKPLLSIDIKQSKILGPDEFLSSFNAWPKEVIILSLSHVGSHRGPDIDMIKLIAKRLNQQTLFYGGGIRDNQDITHLNKLKIDGVLVANSLHTGEFDKNI
ncbi:MAG: HisA/HisF-related TIM barrel protein [Gammaproteobacteria bacterium]